MPLLRLASSTALLTAALALTPAPASANEMTISLGLGGQLSAGGAGGTGSSGFRYRFTDRFGVQVAGQVGHLTATGASGEDDQLFLGLAVGPMLSTGTAPHGWEGLAFLHLTHVHTASVASWERTPGANLAGDSSGGVHHRSGLELGLGVIGPALADHGEGTHVVWEADLIGAVLPSSEPLAWTMALRLSLALRLGDG